MGKVLWQTGRMPTMLAKQPTLLLLAVLFVILWFWKLTSAPPTHKLPNVVDQRTSMSGVKKPYWSMAGNGGALEGVKAFPKPKGLKKVSALIFYGRPASVSILDCYLKRNLVKNGGMLDEVIWVVRTTNAADIAWLDVLLETEPAYRSWNVTFADKDYRGAYDRVEDGAMYIKIDDDVVFFEDTTIPSIVHTKWHHPEYYVVSANIMNQPSLSWVHYHLGAVHPYLPELMSPHPSLIDKEELGSQNPDWRASTLPKWSGPEDFKFALEWEPPLSPSSHRWLPLRPSAPIVSSNITIPSTFPLGIEDTPIRLTTYDPFSPGLWHWSIAAQEHYSFFENLENEELWKYKFHTWDYNYTRMGVQMIAIMGDDINAGKPMKETDDEYYFTQIMPGKLRRKAIVDGRAVAAHYSFMPQAKGLAKTDILARYKSFAKEHICISELT